ncbi:TniQ family protein [Paenibacillus albus]|nr:TniQ family protein [Paenibacillus albus]
MLPFNNRIEPKELESLFSFCHRIARANHFESLPIMMKGKGLNKVSNYNYRESNDPLPLENFMKRTGKEIDRFLMNQFDNVLFECAPNKRMKAKVYLRIHSRYCPDCLQSSHFYRLYWDFTYLTTCVFHKRYLIDRCTNCNKRVNVRNVLSSVCTCGKNLITGKHVDLMLPTDSLLFAQRTIYEAIFNESFSIQRDDGVFIKRKEFFELLFRFCVIIDGLPIKKESSLRGEDKYTFSSNSDIAVISRITEFAFYVVISPNANFNALYRLLESIAYEKPYIFTEKLKILKAIMSHEKGDVYYGEYSQSVTASSRHYVSRRRTITPLNQRHKYIGIMQAVKILGKSYATVKRMCELGILSLNITQTTENKRGVMLIPKEEIDRVKNDFERCLSLKQVREALGLEQKDIEILIAQGKLKACHGPGINGFPEWFIEPESVEQQKCYFQSKIPIVNQETFKEVIPGNKAVFYGRNDPKFSFIDLLDLVLERKIKGGILSREGRMRDLLLEKNSFFEYFGKYNRKHKKTR